MHLAGPLGPEHIILGKTQLQAMPRGLPTEGPCQHTVQVKPGHCYQAGTSSRWPGRSSRHGEYCHCHQRLWRAEDSCSFDLPQECYLPEGCFVLEALSQHPLLANLRLPKEMLEHSLSAESLFHGAFHNW